MKRVSIFVLTIIAAFSLCACSFNKESEEEIPETTEQVIIDEIDDYTTLSYSELEVLGYEGDVEAMLQLGQLYEYGSESVNQDFEKSVQWYEKAYEAGNADAGCELGYFYLTGTGVEQDLEQAQEYFEEAIEGGSINAKVGLGRTYLSKLDEDEMSQLIDMFAVYESDDAVNESDEDTAEAVEEDNKLKDVAEKIVDCFKSADSEGDIDGTYYMGYIYEKGIGVTANATRARSYYEKTVKSTSVELKDQYAINKANTSLGLFYMYGKGVILNQEKALEYFVKASDNGYAKASYYAGQMYENGFGAEQDYEMAMTFYLNAAEKDFAPALNQIGYLYYNGYGVDVNFASAVYYQKLAALQGYAPAQVNLGFLYENGYGVERNLETALSYYELAANAGYDGASEAIVRVRAQMNEEV